MNSLNMFRAGGLLVVESFSMLWSGKSGVAESATADEGRCSGRHVVLPARADPKERVGIQRP